MISEEFDFTDSDMLRKKAEQKLKEKKHLQSPDSTIEMKKLLHELHVHQIELEMQNEELRRAYETTEEALKKYTMLYDMAPMGYLTLDDSGTICDLNFTAAELLSDKRISLIKSNFKLFVSEDSNLVFNEFLNDIFASNAKQSCEVLLSYNKEPLCFTYIEGIVIGEDRKCLLSVVDISSFRKNQNS